MTGTGTGNAWVIDADGHVVEPSDIWDRFLPARYHRLAPRFEERWHEVLYAIPGGTDPTLRAPDMDVDGIERAIVYPSLGLGIQGVTEPEAAVALCRAVNDWVAEYCDGTSGRAVGVGAIPSTAAGDALAEARRCIEELGFRGVFRRPELYPGVLPIHDRSFDELWSYLESADVPIVTHSGFNPFVPIPYFTDRFPDSTVACHATLFPIEAMMALTSFIVYGILERHPRLRVGLVECGAAWAHSYVHRLDEHVETWPDVLGVDPTPMGKLSRKPSEFFRDQCYVSVEEVEPGLAAMLDAYPANVVFASDYPHPDATFPGAVARVTSSPELGPAQLRALCRANALRLYGIPDEGGSPERD